MDIEELRKSAKCVFIELDKSIAQDLSEKLSWAANEIERLTEKINSLIKADK